MSRTKIIVCAGLIGLFTFVTGWIGFSSANGENEGATQTAPVAEVAEVAELTVLFGGEPIAPSPGTVAGIWLYGEQDNASQLLLLGNNVEAALIELKQGDKITFRLSPVKSSDILHFNKEYQTGRIQAKESYIGDRLEWEITAISDSAIKLEQIRLIRNKEAGTLCSVEPVRREFSLQPRPTGPQLSSAIQEALIEWDWKLQDGIGCVRESRTYREAIETMTARGDALIQDVGNAGNEEQSDEQSDWQRAVTRWESLKSQYQSNDADCKKLWKEFHQTRRDLVFAHSLPAVGPLVFAKSVPTTMSHQLTQYYGHCAQPGGGLFLLPNPGKSMQTVPLVVSAETFPQPLAATKNESFKQQGATILPSGSFVNPSISYDGNWLYFAFAKCEDTPPLWKEPVRMNRRFHLYEYNLADPTKGVRQLTDGEYDDFSPVPLPDGNLIFTSSRRGGMHRCGAGPCYQYSLAVLDLKQPVSDESPRDDARFTPEQMGINQEFGATIIAANPEAPDLIAGNSLVVPGAAGSLIARTSDVNVTARPFLGTNPKVVSFHETNEWTPEVMNDGNIIYTRWDYVDRDAVYYQQLWSVRQDGSGVRIYYGNNTFIPNGMWEPQPIPDSSKVMAVGGPHHGMSAGTIFLIDTNQGVDGPAPLTRLTPDALIPECEAPLAFGTMLPAPTEFDTVSTSGWGGGFPNIPEGRVLDESPEQKRWPGHCYKSPLPLSEKTFVVSYSYDMLRGEPGPNIPNMFGLYLMDSFGNKELLYRDPFMSSQWSRRAAARPVPPITATTVDESLPLYEGKPTGTFMLQNVYKRWPEDISEKITSLRIVQLLPKTTPWANHPMLGVPFASPGKQVIGTTPVEEDGSAYFVAPAKVPLLFQALDEKGRAVQTMRSDTYLQPGEQSSCVGCHEDRHSSPTLTTLPVAFNRAPSPVQPGPSGSRPLSYPLLVQPVLNAQCVRCHNGNTDSPDSSSLNLTGEIEGIYTKSYNSLVPFTSWSAWTMPNGNYEPLTPMNQFGARNSKLVELLDAGHYDVELTADQWDRITTWLDTNVLFYGTFMKDKQLIQQQGGEIAGPDLE